MRRIAIAKRQRNARALAAARKRRIEIQKKLAEQKKKQHKITK